MTPMNALFHRAKTRSNGTAFIYDDIVWTYHDLLTGAERLSRAFVARGVRQGDRVVLHMPNSPEMAVALYACFRVGARARRTCGSRPLNFARSSSACSPLSILATSRFIPT
jgi:long-chain acyl-CoA synthetase